MQYAIMQFNKMRNATKFLENHHRNFCNKDYYIIKPQNSYHAEIESRIEKAGCKVRRDSIKLVDTLVTAAPEFFKKHSTRNFFELATAFLTSKVGEQNVFSVVVHMSEQTPHMHFCFTPITNDGQLSAKEIIGNRQKLIEWQGKFYKQLSAFYPELERNK